MKKIVFYIALLLNFLPADVFCAADSLQYQHFTIDNDLPSNNIYSCVKDDNGYLWFTSDNGLIKYNGYNFRVFNVANAHLPANDIYMLRKDKLGRMWTYSLVRDFGYIQNDKYYPLTFQNNNIGRLSRGDALCTIKGITFFSLILNDVRGIVAYKDPAHYIFIPFPYYLLGISGSGDVYFIANNAFYCKNIFRPFSLYPLKGRVRKDIQVSSDMSYVAPSSFYFFRKDLRNITSIDIRTGASKMFFYPFEPDEFLYSYGFPAGINQFITNKNIYISDSNLKVIYKEPVLPYAGRNQVAFYYRDSIYRNSWYCTNGDGIWKKNDDKVLLKKNMLLQDIKGARFVGSDLHHSFWWNYKNLLLYRLDEKEKLLQQPLTTGRVQSTAYYDDSSVIICTASEALLFNMLTGKKTLYFDTSRPYVSLMDTTHGKHPTPKSLPRIEASQLIWDFKGRLLAYRMKDKSIFSSSAGNVLYYTSQDTIFSIRYKGDERYDRMDPQPILGKVIFFGGQSVNIYDTVTDRLQTINTSRVPMIFGKIAAIKHDRLNNIFILTDDHLIMLNPFTLHSRMLSRNFNLSQAKIEIVNDKLIVAGRFGVAAATITGLGETGPLIITANIKDKFYREVTGIWHASDSAVVIQTDKAVYEINPDSLLKNGADYATSDNGKFRLAVNIPYNKAIRTADTVLLTNEDKQLVLDALNFYGNGNVTYSYSISREGDDDNWQTSSSGEILLAGIMPGIYYHFKIKASDDVWKSDVTNVMLYITPYWYQTHNARIFFLIAGALIIILAVIGGVSLARQAVIRAQAKRRALTELELRAVHSQINPHFIFNTLSTALYFIDRKDYDNAYKHVNKFSHLLRSYLKSSHDRYVLLSEEIDMLKRYIELQQARFEHLFSYEIKVENRVPADNVQIPSLLLQPLVENAINHGLFHRKEPGGRLFISFVQGNTSDELICAIEDNGIGRMRAMDMKKQNDAERQSYGSRLTDKLVDIFRQYEAMNIHIEYIDKVAPDTGTIVKLTIGNVKYIV